MLKFVHSTVQYWFKLLKSKSEKTCCWHLTVTYRSACSESLLMAGLDTIQCCSCKHVCLLLCEVAPVPPFYFQKSRIILLSSALHRNLPVMSSAHFTTRQSALDSDVWRNFIFILSGIGSQLECVCECCGGGGRRWVIASLWLTEILIGCRWIRSQVVRELQRHI